MDEGMLAWERRKGNRTHGRERSASLVCIECSREWTDRAQRWRALIGDVEDGLWLYCDLCAEREFGPAGHRVR